MLLWISIYKYLFQSLILIVCVYPQKLDAESDGNCILHFSRNHCTVYFTTAAPFYILTSYAQGFPFLHILTSTCYFLFSFSFLSPSPPPVVPGFEFRSSHLLGRHSTTWASTPALSFLDNTHNNGYEMLTLLLFFFPGRTGVWTQGFILTKQVLTKQALYCFELHLQSILLWLFWK
jgi:hypothetical protein